MKRLIVIGTAVFLLLVTWQNGRTQDNGVVWEPCRIKVDGKRITANCTTLTVPENRNDPHSRLISLPVMHIPATGPNPAEPIFHLNGGPGMSNMSFRPPAALLENHDVVLVGYRGVDGSVVLDCPEVATAVTGQNGDLFSETAQAGMAAAITACGRRLRQEGVDLDGYSVLEVVEDVEAARQMLGYACIEPGQTCTKHSQSSGRIHLLSESYGTRLAQIYAQRYPDNLVRSVMIGVNPPGRFVWEPAMIDAQLEQYAGLCAQDAACQQRTTNLAETMRQVNDNMPRRWLFFPIAPDKVKAVTFMLLFHRQTAALAFGAYLSAAGGDASGLAVLSLAYDLLVPRAFTWGEFLAKGFSADFDPQRDYSQLAAPDSVMGSPISQLVWPVAAGWPMATIPDDYRRAQPTAVPTLLISGSLDFSTPAGYATNDLLPVLKNGRQLILSEMGHTNDFWKIQPEAAAQLLQTYFDSGEVDETLFDYHPMTFTTGFLSLPRLARLMIALPLLVIGLLGGWVGWLWRARRQRGC